MIKNPKTQETLDALKASLQQAYAEFQAARTTLATLEQNAATLRSAAAAAETDAGRIRGELRDLLRQSVGKPGKSLHQKSAEQRAAIELVEEYTALVADLKLETERARLKLTPPAEKVIRLRQTLARTFADALIGEAITEVAPRLQLGLLIQAQLEDGEFFNERIKTHWGDAKRLVHADLAKSIATALSAADTPTLMLPDDLREALKCAHLEGFVPLSPLQQKLATRTLVSHISPQEAA
ncbi:hypothetical protein [Parazoarcus communis]|uniref:Uncharacterized protein n=1 Tax=Parazoarcus communis SWub3 = DSM 12120 TaxID=1121029 RepID=A0A323UWU5_9RHOO|nr:hypothetical protein [Parazoarcus communis]NMG72284.1 hypothetical protein [Parazoarcus communis SWub3 = DSM 12120]PZA16423.1 hypothetical protein DNK49_12295 [Azoarcus communis] [Parazoarcus communis SWub3 = DSM 12120]